MNSLNNASLEASQRLRDAGIVLETEILWVLTYTNPTWFLCTQEDHSEYFEFNEKIPAPSMAEVWRELPTYTELIRSKWDTASFHEKSCQGANTVDCLIDLLIWVRKEKP